MISFLYWNINNSFIQDTISRLVMQNEADILILSECSIDPGALLASLNHGNPVKYHYAPGIGCTRIEIFTRFSNKLLIPIFESDRLTIRHLKLPGLTNILIAANHFPSKRNWKDSSQAFECVILADSIRIAEDEVGHSKTVLIGDFNMNPFEEGVISARGLHAVMTKNIALKNSRIVQGNKYLFFYNPMWSLFGDGSPGPAGTYYFSSSEHNVIFWNIFDQVLIRPDLVGLFKNEDLRILESDGVKSFLTRQKVPDIQRYSDHLPIFFKLNL